jgi:hypothetical protein
MGVRFLQPEDRLSEDDIRWIETDLGMRLPNGVRSLYLAFNGGVPSAYVFTNANVDTVVAELLPLKAAGKGTAVDTYRKLVLSLNLVAPSMFPFAVDGSGDYFLVDCRTDVGNVYLYRGDTASESPLVDLGCTFDAFWSSLTTCQIRT